jgi:hypothetical protein
VADAVSQQRQATLHQIGADDRRHGSDDQGGQQGSLHQGGF